eukprot:NODE_5454_length_1768_cov_12.737965.p2 GENE.NODE_5454_length_1768_cov_12.737965~~NODE_5454_length_1768_cov_12.737965.p2  ORF type:complete len:341 (+),score=73.62 NODE_5454_length_1768_cov_12.737965:487-1509(+)
MGRCLAVCRCTLRPRSMRRSRLRASCLMMVSRKPASASLTRRRTPSRKKWAKEVLVRMSEGHESFDEAVDHSYYDFLNVMLGRKRFPITLYMYDISKGVAQKWSWLLLGQNFEGIWHTGVVVDWPTISAEFWFGGRLFQSKPETTPFGTPVRKVDIGYTYKHPEETWDHIKRVLVSEFTPENYDVLTHNCNHFSDKLCMFLHHEHIPDEVRKQPEMVMNTLTARALRPVLNHWLGNFNSEEGRATDGGEELSKLWDDVQPGALVRCSQNEGGRPFIGEVLEVVGDFCMVRRLDFWRGDAVDLDVNKQLVQAILLCAPPGMHTLVRATTPKQVGCRWLGSC